MSSSSSFTTKDLEFGGFIRYPDISLPAGAATFITGPSGSGKTTLLKLLNGAVSPSGGMISYRGADISTLDTIALRRKVTLAGQSVFLFDKSIRDNFAEFHACRDMPPPSEADMRFFLKTVGADFPPDDNVTSMSGGERQRIFIAICLSFRPEVLMLDEPTSALDADNAECFLRGLKEFEGGGNTLVIVSHDKPLIKQFADNVINLGGKA